MKLNTLIQIYHQLNREIFAEVLTPPLFFATRSRDEFASYVEGISVPSEIHFNSRYIKGHWARSIVYHEMIHQYLAEFLQINETNHHGELFWQEYRKFAPFDIVLFEGL